MNIGESLISISNMGRFHELTRDEWLIELGMKHKTSNREIPRKDYAFFKKQYDLGGISRVIDQIQRKYDWSRTTSRKHAKIFVNEHLGVDLNSKDLFKRKRIKISDEKMRKIIAGEPKKDIKGYYQEVGDKMGISAHSLYCKAWKFKKKVQFNE